MLYQGSLGNLLDMIDEIPWNYWIYSELFEELTNDTQCLALDVDTADLGEDGFTPLEVEKRGYQELISIQDLKGVLNNMRSIEGDVSILSAMDYFIKNDAYLN